MSSRQHGVEDESGLEETTRESTGTLWYFRPWVWLDEIWSRECRGWPEGVSMLRGQGGEEGLVKEMEQEWPVRDWEDHVRVKAKEPGDQSVSRRRQWSTGTKLLLSPVRWWVRIGCWLLQCGSHFTKCLVKAFLWSSGAQKEGEWRKGCEGADNCPPSEEQCRHKGGGGWKGAIKRGLPLWRWEVLQHVNCQKRT